MFGSNRDSVSCFLVPDEGGGMSGGQSNVNSPQNNSPPADLPKGNTVNLPQEEYEKLLSLSEAVKNGSYVQKETYEDKVKEVSDAKISAEKTAQELGKKMADVSQKAQNLGITLKEQAQNYNDLLRDYGEKVKEKFGYGNFLLGDRTDELERNIKNLESMVQESLIYKTTVGSKSNAGMVNSTKIARIAKGEMV